MTKQPFVDQALEWIRAAYPQGVPRADYPPLLGALRQTLTRDEVTSIVPQLADRSETRDPVTAADVTRLIEAKAHRDVAPADLARVSGRLVAGGWPLATSADEDAEEASDETTREGTLLSRVISWLREGYPEGVPDRDYVPLLALLQRRLTKAEVKKVAKTLRRSDVRPATPADIAAAISEVTKDEPSEADLERVQVRLTKKGWPVELPDLKDPLGQ